MSGKKSEFDANAHSQMQNKTKCSPTIAISDDCTALGDHTLE